MLACSLFLNYLHVLIYMKTKLVYFKAWRWVKPGLKEEINCVDVFCLFVFCLWFLRRQQYVGKVRFSHFDTHMQLSKKVLIATESNVFAALNTRTGELCKYLQYKKCACPLNITFNIHI